MKILDPVQEIKDNLPELENISDYGNSKTISYQMWDNRMKTIETKNLNKYGRSTSWGSLQHWFNPCVICYNSSYNTVTFNQEKYKLIRKYVMSEEFNKKGV